MDLKNVNDLIERSFSGILKRIIIRLNKYIIWHIFFLNSIKTNRKRREWYLKSGDRHFAKCQHYSFLLILSDHVLQKVRQKIEAWPSVCSKQFGYRDTLKSSLFNDYYNNCNLNLEFVFLWLPPPHLLPWGRNLFSENKQQGQARDGTICLTYRVSSIPLPNKNHLQQLIGHWLWDTL